MALRDESLTHQAVISYYRDGTYVSCNCRATVGEHEKAGKIYYDHIGKTTNYQETRALYNNPENHWAPFSKEDELRR